jgi:aspartyl/asparaginyl beta-hydroxylase (cupin superfamily)
MRRRIFMLAFVLALAAGITFAHGNKVHVRGTVEKISADSVVVKAPDGKSVEVKLMPATVYILRSNGQDKPAKFANLAAGDFVVIHATPKDSSLEADEVRFSAPATPKPAASPSPKAKP